MSDDATVRRTCCVVTSRDRFLQSIQFETEEYMSPVHTSTTNRSWIGICQAFNVNHLEQLLQVDLSVKAAAWAVNGERDSYVQSKLQDT